MHIMITTWNQLIALLPILIISITIIIIMLSIAYGRNQFKHAVLTIIGLTLSGISSFNTIWKNQPAYSLDQLIYVDNYSVLYIVLIVIAGLSSTISVYTWLLCYPNTRRDEFFLLLLLSSMGGILLTMSNNLVTLFLGIELISLPLFGLIGYSFFQRSSIESSIKYVMLSGIASSFLLFGIALIYAETRCLSFMGIKEVLFIQSNSITTSFLQQSVLLTMTGLIMILVGFAFKLSAVPFHIWTPDIYQGSSAAVSMFLATGSKIAVISALIRFLLIFPSCYHKIFYIFLSVSACCSMLFGSIMAIQQNNIKRILAYSSITNSGYVLVMLLTSYVNYPIFIQEVIGIYFISYLFSIIGAFAIVNIISKFCIQKNLDTILIYQGLFWRVPTLSIIFTIIILSLAGIPMTLGFIGKFYLLLTGISNQLWFLTVIMVISSIISIIYYLKMIVNLYLPPIYSDNSNFDYNCLNDWFYNPNGMMIIFFSFIILVLGVYPQPMINLICLICK